MNQMFSKELILLSFLFYFLYLIICVPDELADIYPLDQHYE